MNQPPATVRDAFRCEARLEFLAGGEGRTWRSGARVLKRVDSSEQAEWTSEVLAPLWTPPSIVVPRPIAASRGEWVVDGWTCQEYIDARRIPHRWTDIIDAGRVLHRCLAGVPRPAWMDRADDWWRRGDAVAWEGRTAVGPVPYLALLDRLFALRRPVASAAQIVHGDLCGNVLFDATGRPVLIDFSPYFRPSEWANAVVAIDAFEWEGAGPQALHWLDDVESSEQLLVRAAIFRIATSAEVAVVRGFDETQFRVHAATVAAIEERCRHLS